ncbi:MAG: hypothetical protein TEF_13840 [Rhizobiales bacterium NRL2]|jgi:hypothetical protein|nr:MAG: hypothetical protein TEF_13840 [Rhizobiales bacterium NRL2]
MDSMTDMNRDSEQKRGLSRRAALTRLGLGAAALYAAPTVTRLDTARAAFPSGGCGSGPGVGFGRGGGNGQGGGFGCGGGTSNNPNNDPNDNAFKKGNK